MLSSRNRSALATSRYLFPASAVLSFPVILYFIFKVMEYSREENILRNPQAFAEDRCQLVSVPRVEILTSQFYGYENRLREAKTWVSVNRGTRNAELGLPVVNPQLDTARPGAESGRGAEGREGVVAVFGEASPAVAGVALTCSLVSSWWGALRKEWGVGLGAWGVGRSPD